MTKLPLLVWLLVAFPVSIHAQNAAFRVANINGRQIASLGQEQSNIDELHAKLLKLFREGSYTKAAPVAEQLLSAIDRDSSGPSHFVRPLFDIAELFQAMNDLSRAEPVYQRVMEILSRGQSKVTDSMALSMGRYACLKRKNNQAKEAEALERRAYGISVGAAKDKIESTAVRPFKTVKNGRVIELPQPERQGASGTVIVRVVIDESAKVILACAVEGNPKLAPAAEQAAYRARFTPTVVDDKPVKVSGVISYNFR